MSFSGTNANHEPTKQYPPMHSQSSDPGKPIVGLIGGMGSGKSFVAAELARHGGRVISGDQAGHEALRQPDIKASLAARWGSEVLDAGGEIDRRAVARRVFHDNGERKALEALVFPFIEQRFREESAKARRDPAVRFVVLDAAIMLEAGWNNVCDRLVYVDSPRALRLHRLAEQRGWTEKEVEAREQAQMPLEEKRRRADAVIDNSGTPDDAARQVEALLRRWQLISCP
jgi:dephospho-CoA kinase